MIFRLRKGDANYKRDKELMKSRVLDCVEMHPYCKGWEIKAMMADRYWVTDVQDALDSLTDEGRIVIRRMGPWDVLVPGGMI